VGRLSPLPLAKKEKEEKGELRREELLHLLLYEKLGKEGRDLH